MLTDGRAGHPPTRRLYAQRVRRKLARRQRRPVAIGRRERPARLSPRGPHEHHASDAVPRELARKVPPHARRSVVAKQDRASFALRAPIRLQCCLDAESTTQSNSWCRSSDASA